MENPLQNFKTGAYSYNQGKRNNSYGGNEGDREADNLSVKTNTSNHSNIGYFDLSVSSEITGAFELDNQNGESSCSLDETELLQRNKIDLCNVDTSFNKMVFISGTTSSDESNSVNFDTTEVDAKKVDEWLKGRSDSFSSMVFESDGEEMSLFGANSCASPKLTTHTHKIVDVKDNITDKHTKLQTVEGIHILPNSSNEETSSNDYIEILVKTSEGEQIYRVKSKVDFPDELSELIAENKSITQNQTDGAQATDLEAVQASIIIENQNSACVNDEVEEDSSTLKIPSFIKNGLKTVKHNCPVEGCNQSFAKECKLRVHLMSHEETRQFKCTYEGCDWSFISQYRLSRHLLSHNDRKSYMCDEPGCTRRFTTIYNLNSHKSLHKRPDLFECLAANCEQKFPTRRKMELHLREHDDVEAPYMCPITDCGKSFYSATFLSSHLRVHQYPSNDLKCPFPECAKVYDRICHLRQHIRSHTGERPYVCTHEGCSWTFITASKLTRHMRKHTGERKYICPEPGCGKSFMRPEHLKGHVTVHSGDKPFMCEHEGCPAKFTAKSSLYVHLKKHDNDQKLVYPCPIEACIKKYISKASLRSHLLKFHSSVLEGALTEDLTSDTKASEFVFAGNEPIHIPIGSESSLFLSEDEFGQPLLVGDSMVECIMPHPLECTLNSRLEQAKSSTDTQLAVNTILENVPTLAIVNLPQEETVLLDNQLDSSLLPSLPEINGGGSARTDYCSNLILSSRAKKRRLLRQQFQNKEPTDTADPLLGEMLNTSDVFLGPNITYAEAGHFSHSQLLQDEHPVIYSEDNILDSITNELQEPLLSESSVNVFPVQGLE